jgi:hypothetical protein
MLKLSRKALLVAAVPLLASAIAAPKFVQAQPDDKLPLPPKQVVNVPCCRCLDGKVNTININTGTAPWRLIEGPSITPGLATTVTTPNPGWTTGAPAQWVSNNASGTASAPAGTYVYELPIRVPNCVIPMTINFSGKVAADNGYKAILIAPNGASSAVGSGAAPTSFQNPTPISGTLTAPGLYRLRVHVTNQGGPQGLLVNAILKTQCSNKLEKDGMAAAEEGPKLETP